MKSVSASVEGRHWDNESTESPGLLRQLTAEIVSAFVSANQISPASLPELIRSVHEALCSTDVPPQPEAEPLRPAVSVRRSVTPEFLICLEDGQKLKMLKRYLRTNYDMSPEEYRAKWGLPSDYPMVAPNYASRRSQLAKQIGLGRNRDGGEAGVGA